MAGRTLLLAAIFPLAFAFSDTNPVVAWTSRSSELIDKLPSLSNSGSYGSILESISSSDAICAHEAIVFVEHPGLHASDLRALSPSSNLAITLNSAPSSRQVPYVQSSTLSLSAVVEAVATRCNSQVIQRGLGQPGPKLDSNGKYVIYINMPELQGNAWERKASMAEHESLLSVELDAIASALPDNLVVYAGVPSSLAPSKRQSHGPPHEIHHKPIPSDLLATLGLSNSTLTKGGILKRYQLLTPALITTLLITFFILFPVLFLGVSALASIQSPLRFEAPKGYNAGDKKNN